MKTTWMALGALASALALAACGEKAEDTTAPSPAATAPAKASGPMSPDRKPGLWQQTINMDGKPLMTTRLCIDATADKKLQLWGNEQAADDCKVTGPSRNLDGSFSFTSVCDMQGGIKTSTQGRATGDFNTNYKVEADSQTTGAPSAEINGSHKMLIEASWTGACPAGWTPGDMEMPNGMRMNILALRETGIDPEATAKAAMAEAMKRAGQ